MANKENKFDKVHKALRIEVATKTQRKNASIRRNAECAAKKIYKMLRPTIVMQKVRGNSLFFKLSDGVELFIYITNEGNPFCPADSAPPTVKMACTHRKKRSKLTPEDRKLFDKIYAEELAGYFNLKTLDCNEYHVLNV